MKDQLIGNSKANQISLLGSLGPSVFLHAYNYARPNKSETNPLVKFYYLLVTSDVEAVFNSMSEYINDINDEAERMVLIAYFKGYLNMYSLERNVQPFIYYFGGFRRSRKIMDTSAFVRMALETSIDVLFEQTLRESTPLHKIINVSNIDVKIISKMFYNIAINVYSLSDIKQDSFCGACKKIKTRLAAISSPFPSVRKLINAIFPSKYVRSSIRTKKVERTDKYDYLNLRKNTWRHPTAGVEINADFLQLFNDAKEENQYVNMIVKKVANRKSIKSDLKEFCMDINYFGFQYNTEPIFLDSVRE